MSELKKVAEALLALKGDGRFAVEQACPSEHLQITVEGVGPIAFPISAATARALSSIARPAPFGRRDRTLYDRSVRDTGEIEKSRIRIDARAWKKTLDPQLTMLRDRLGLAKTGKLRAVLDKMLVYGRGQFFAAHQDSEKAGDMVGTLVVELPSRHSGGATTVEHHGEKLEFSGAPRGPQDLSLLAFYSDCRHEVKPVQSGHRVVLTYRLHHSEGANEEAPADLAARIDRLASTVESYFASPAAMVRGSTSQVAPQERLVYLLDHEYTQQSLGWEHLKNGDRVCAGALRQVAERLDCEVFLALADVHESWSCEEDEDDRYGGREHYRDSEEEEEEEDDEETKTEDEKNDYDLIELCDSDIELRHWVGPTGEVAPAVSTSVMEDELCFTLASVDMNPWKTEHEGNMGNYGNTVDRWYHRAALVMWPRALNYVVRARVSPAWAIWQIEEALAAGDMKDARVKAASLLPFWHRSAPEEKGRVVLRQAVRAFALARRWGAGASAAFTVESGPPDTSRHVGVRGARRALWARLVAAPVLRLVQTQSLRFAAAAHLIAPAVRGVVGEWRDVGSSAGPLAPGSRNGEIRGESRASSAANLGGRGDRQRHSLGDGRAPRRRPGARCGGDSRSDRCIPHRARDGTPTSPGGCAAPIVSRRSKARRGESARTSPTPQPCGQRARSCRGRPAATSRRLVDRVSRRVFVRAV